MAKAVDLAIRPGSNPDWFLLPRPLIRARLQDLQVLVGVPGRRITKLGQEIHRTHLPLLLADLQPDDPRDKWESRHFGRTVLRPYQHVGREFLMTRRGALLADQMRLGKTAQIVAAWRKSWGQLVIVAPLATRPVWLAWCKRIWPESEVRVLHGRTYDRATLEQSEILFVHYEILGDWASAGYRAEIDMVVFDEAHLLSNRTSRRSQGAAILSSQARRTVLATGTPIWNQPARLHSLLHLATPGAWGSFHEFGVRYAAGATDAYGWHYEGTSNEEELKQRLSEVMLRRVWQDVVDEVPAITRSVEVVDVSPDDHLKLEKLVEGSRLDPGANRSIIGELARYRRAIGMLKVDAAAQAAGRVLQADGSVVLWVWHEDVANALGDALRPVIRDTGRCISYITGDVPPDARALHLNNWQQLGGALIMSIPIGQAGIDLSHARHAIFVETDWTPAVIAQAEMRTFSPDRPMSVTYIVADHPIDRTVVRTLIKKVGRAERLGVPAADTALDTIREAMNFYDEEVGDFLDLFDDDLEGGI